MLTIEGQVFWHQNGKTFIPRVSLEFNGIKHFGACESEELFQDAFITLSSVMESASYLMSVDSQSIRDPQKFIEGLPYIIRTWSSHTKNAESSKF